MLKRIFYASASILMLALAYEFTASRATGQAGVSIECATVATSPDLSVYAVINRHLYVQPAFGQPLCTAAALVDPGPIPGTSPAIACGINKVVLANGEVWVSNSPGWFLCQNLLTGSTPAARPTFGQLKAQYRR